MKSSFVQRPSAVRKPHKSLSLRPLLIVPFVAQIFLAVGLTGYLSFRNGQQSVNEVASQLRREIVARIQERLSIYLATPHSINQINADAVRYGTLDLSNYNLMMSHFWQQIQAFELMSLIYVGNEQGEYIGAGREGGTITVDLVNESTGGYYHAYLPDAQGYPAQLSNTLSRPYDPRRRPWYIATVENQSPIWSPIYTYFSPPALGITATRPLYSDTGELLAIFATDLSLSTISQFLSTLKVGKTGQSFILERSGILVATSTANPPYRLNEKGEAEPITGDRSTNPVTQATTRYLYEHFGSLEQIQQPQQLAFKFNQERLFLEVSPISDRYGINWLVIVAIPEADFMEQIHANARTTIGLCLLTLGVATVAGIAIARRVIRPVTQLNQAVSAIAQGDLERRVSVTGIDELETLGQSFNQMAIQLQTSFSALEEVNRELENRVEERTTELRLANQEISSLNEQLKEENVRMSAELDVARKIQQMILPKEQELTAIPDLEIAGFMEAANEVGGDYYDILQGENQIKIGIGDVTGHGLESGVLMIMVQTAVRTLLAVNERDPVKIFNALNQTIYRNVQRMNSHKNLTLSLLDYWEGNLYLSGQHEEAIVVRRNGEIERIDTDELGFPIGLVEDISTFVGQHSLYLNPGDGIVLYTDGVTEAENSDRALYGIERLMTIIQQNWSRSCSEIRASLVEDIRQHIGDHTIYDDITLVVVKRRA